MAIIKFRSDRQRQLIGLAVLGLWISGVVLLAYLTQRPVAFLFIGAAPLVTWPFWKVRRP